MLSIFDEICSASVEVWPLPGAWVTELLRVVLVAQNHKKFKFPMVSILANDTLGLIKCSVLYIANFISYRSWTPRMTLSIEWPNNINSCNWVDFIKNDCQYVFNFFSYRYYSVNGLLLLILPCSKFSKFSLTYYLLWWWLLDSKVEHYIIVLK